MLASRLFIPVAAFGLAAALPSAARAAGAGTGRSAASEAMVRAYEASYAHAMTPSFARQTGLACNVCHTHYPELTATGRAFKLNGYLLRRADSLQGASPMGSQNLLLNLVTPLSFMVQTSYTQTSKAQPGTQNGTIFLPDELSIFTGGEITPHVGSFLQLTIDPQDGAFGLDNADIRYANNTTLFGAHTVYGLSLNNNPTVQDLWNSTPAWGFPYGSSAAAPSPDAHAMIDDLGGQVAGLTAYTMWNDRVYAEIGAYRAAPLGSERPIALDSSAAGLVSGFAPYWRVAFPFSVGNNTMSVGAYGMRVSQFSGAGGDPVDRFTDVAVDATLLAPMGSNSFTIDATYIHEAQHRPSGAGANRDNTLRTVRLDGMYHVGHRWAFTVAPFLTSGTSDSLLYPAGSGFANNSPNSRGVIGEADLMPWQNLRLQLQYVAYGRFNGAATNYDGAGRNARDNNTLYFLTWLLF